MENLKPSHFKSFPWNSVLNKTEAEVIAQNIMIIRARNGDKWSLSWDEYKKERLKDGEFSLMEKGYFEKVIGLISDAYGAIRFCADWAEAAKKAMKK